MGQRPGGGGNASSEKSGELSGRILDFESKTPMSYVTISIFNERDSSLLTGGITNDAGEFIIKNIPLGKLYVKISFIGYEPKFIQSLKLSPDNNTKDFGDIILNADKEVLESVEVTADKPLVTYEIDKKVVNVENMTTVASGTAIDVLQNIPSITVDMDGNVSLRGSSGFTLLIDGRPANMEATDALQMIPATNIKDIEIITNPSAKYNAEGNAGIINIILKKDKLEGVSTLINANAGNYDNYGGDILISVNKEKVKFNIGGDYKNMNRFRDIEQIRETTINEDKSRIEGEGLHRFFRTNYGVNAALEYNPNRKNSFSFGVNGNQRQYNAASNYYFTEYLNDSLTSNFENRESTLRQFFGFAVNGGYMHYFQGNKEHKLSFSGNYNYRNGEEIADAKYYNGSEEFVGGNKSTELGPSITTRLNLDYELPFKNKQKFLTGLQADLGNSADDQDSYQYEDSIGDYVSLPLYSTDVSYQQDVYAAYGIFNGKWKEKLGYQFGLRGEFTNRHIAITTGTLETTVQRMDWFPSAHFSYNLDDKNQLMANASRRIQRPRSWALEPFIAWEDPYTVRQGNVNLLPEYIQSFELGYIRSLTKGSFSTEFYFRNTNNIEQRIQEVYAPNVIIKRPVNAGTSQALGTEISYRKTFKKWWSFDFGTNLFYYKISGEISGEPLDQESFTYNVRLGNNFNLKNDFKIQLVGKYESERVNAQGRSSASYEVDVALKKDFWEHKLSTSLQVRNILNSEINEDYVQTSTLYSYKKALPKWPIVAVSISLKLNNYKQQDKLENSEGSEF